MRERSVFILLSVVMASCSLDIESTMDYKEKDFWKTEADFDAALTGCYNALYSVYLFGGDATPLFFETMTPNAYNYNNSYGFSVIAEGTQTTSNSLIINNRWKECYGAIGRCNTLIDRLVAFEMEHGKKKRMLSETLFLRALYYFLLTEHYGDVPLILDAPDEDKQALLPRTAKAVVVNQMLDDLDSAVLYLPPSYKTENIGRATCGAVTALKSRILLYNGQWAAAEKEAEKVMLSATYSLFPDYRGLFLVENENNPEVIFDIRFDMKGTCNSADVVLQLYNTSAPLLNLVKAYQMRDGTDYNELKPLYSDRDPRFYATIVYPGAWFLGKMVTNNTFSMTGYAFKKYTRYDSLAQPLVLSRDRSDINYIYLRYADLLLTYAEARNERLARPDKAVYDALNEVRQRPGVEMPPYEFARAYTQEEMRKLIRQERRIEFAGEGLYYADIIRWRTAAEVMNSEIRRYDGVKIMRRYFDETKGYLWPVPDRETRYNPNLLPNNPGY